MKAIKHKFLLAVKLQLSYLTMHFTKVILNFEVCIEQENI